MMRSRKINGANAKWYCEVFYTAARAVSLTEHPDLVRNWLIEVKHHSFMRFQKMITIRNIHYRILLQLTARRPPAAHTIFILHLLGIPMSIPETSYNCGLGPQYTITSFEG